MFDVPEQTPARSGVFSDMIQYFDPELIRALWMKTFEGFGPHGSKVVRDEGTLVWISDRIRMASRNGRSPVEVAGVALYLIVAKNPFIDCNHRSGWLVCQTIMELAGFELVRPTNEVVDFVKSIDRLELTENTVIEWVGHSFLRLG